MASTDNSKNAQEAQVGDVELTERIKARRLKDLERFRTLGQQKRQFYRTDDDESSAKQLKRKGTHSRVAPPGTPPASLPPPSQSVSFPSPQPPRRHPVRHQLSPDEQADLELQAVLAQSLAEAEALMSYEALCLLEDVPLPLSKTVRDALLLRTVLKEATVDAGLCPICQLDYEEGDVVVKLPCQHEFHKECAFGWFERRRTCCICKLEVTSSGQK